MTELAAGSGEPRFTGFIDDLSSGRLQGWAVDRDASGFHACLVVFAGDLIVGACRADGRRPDLVDLMPGEGLHGFDCPLREEAFEADGIEVFAVARDVFDAVVRGGIADDDDHPLHGRAAFVRTFDGRVGRILGANLASPALSEIRGDATGDGSGSRADAAGSILVDILDLLAFHRVHMRVTGIQRVLCGLISSLSASDGRDELQFCFLGIRPGAVRIVDRALLEGFVASLLRGDANRSDLDAQIAALEGGARPHRTRGGDTFFMAGAFWISERLDRHLARMRERGTRVGLFVYDLIPITHPHLTSASTRRQFTARAVEPLSLSDFLFTISRFVAGQAEALLRHELGHTPPIRVIPLPHRSLAEEREGGSTGGEGSRRSFPALGERPFVLCVCTIEGRKNHILLHRLWAGLLRKHGPASVPRLVIVGRWGWNVEEFRQALDDSDDLDGAITLLTDLDDAALAGLYARCLFTVFPSFAEGWGLPVGESLAAGRLCVASRATAIPEVGGAFCDYFDPHDYLDAFAAVERAIFDRNWREMRERSIASTFRPRNWADTAADFLGSLRAAHAEVRIEGGRGAAPVHRSTDVIDFAALADHDELSPWSTRAAKFVLTAGWHAPDRGGVRASARTSEIAMPTDLPPGTPVTVLLRLAASGSGRGCRLDVRSGGDATTIDVLGRTPRWHPVRGSVSPGGALHLKILGPPAEPILSGQPGPSSFNLSAIALFDESAREDRATTYQKLSGMRPPRTEAPTVPPSTA